MTKINIPRVPGESDIDYRRRYFLEWDRLDREKKGLPPRKPRGTVTMCEVEGCDQPAKSKGLCGKHYGAKFARERRLRDDLPPGKTNHPLYRAWFDRKSADALCPAWLDFWTFVRDVGERPSEEHTLRRRPWEPYGPDNFEWHVRGKRRPEETRQDHHRRLSREGYKPAAGLRNHLIRTFGITTERYEEMLKEQGGVCAICGLPETRPSSKSNKVTRLAVDHCHGTGIVRDLLCWRCNSLLGKAGESIDLLLRVVGYIQKWADPEAASKGRPEPVQPEARSITIQTPEGPLALPDAARMAGLPLNTVRSRIRLGWPEDKWLVPLQRKKREAS